MPSSHVSRNQRYRVRAELNLLLFVAGALLLLNPATAQQCASSGPPCKLACNSKACDAGTLAAWTSSRKAAAVTQQERGSSARAPPMREVIARAVSVAQRQATLATNKLSPAQYPSATAPGSGEWQTTPANRWTAGFFAGVLWQLHALTGGKGEWAALARKWQAGLADKQSDWGYQHDLGFVYLPSFAHSYTVTGSPADLRQALAAAEALAWAYNPATRSLRTFEGWQPPRATTLYKQLVIIDFMMNIQLLVWGAKHVGRLPANSLLDAAHHSAAAWTNMAVSHARQVRANHVRSDGTTYHIVEYDPEKGSINGRYTYQGYADNSTWARGQSWAIAGFAMLANELPQYRREFADAAVVVADRWLQLVTQRGEFVPPWDFDAPPGAPRDSAAAAVAALGLLHLSEALATSGNRDCSQKYLCAAVGTLHALASPKYLAGKEDGRFAAVLKHATGNLPAQLQVDVGLVYADYYFLAALAKCKSMKACSGFGGY